MVQIVVKSWWPRNKGPEVQKKFAELQQEKGGSPAIKSGEIYFSSGKHGMRSRAYSEVELGNIEAALTYLADFMTGFNEIDGYYYKFSFATSQTEAAAAAQQG